jgi:hypothetical protein
MSSAVLQPSLFEGWSTVVEDVKAMGRPLFLSDIPVHLEQAPSATFFKAGSPEDLASTLEQSIDGLREGPDRVAECHAQEQTEKRRYELAKEFIRIARSAITRAECER